MRTCLLLVVVLALAGTARAACDACVNRQCYEKHLLHEHVSNERPGMYLKENFLYTRIKNGFSTVIRRYDLDTGAYKELEEEYSCWKFTVDQDTGDIYIRTLGGVFKIDSDMKFQHWVISQTMYNIFFKDKLYASPIRGLYTLDRGVLHIVPGIEEYKVDEIIVDNHDDIYFRELEKLYKIRRIKEGSTNVTRLSTADYALATDKDGNAIFLNTDSGAIYRIDASNGELVEFGSLPESTPWVVFDRNNNIIYNHLGKLYHLKRGQTNTRCAVKIYGGAARYIVEDDSSEPEVITTAAGNDAALETNTYPSTTPPNSQTTTEQTCKPSFPDVEIITIDIRAPSDNKDHGKHEGCQSCDCKSLELLNYTIEIDIY